MSVAGSSSMSSADRLIVIAGMSRGGTSLLWNIVQSHPQVIDTYYELNEIFGGKTDIRPAEKSCIELEALCGLPLPAVRRLTRTRLVRFARLSFEQDEFNREKRPGLRYSASEFPSLRICTKLVSSWETDPLRKLLRRNDALKYLPLLRRTYAQVAVIFLVRNGLAVADGWGRRGAPVQTAASWYRHYVGCYEDYVSANPGQALIVRFEDILEDPFRLAARIYAEIGLETAPAQDLRIAVKPTIHANLAVANTTRKTKRWIDRHNWRDYIDVGINEAQIARMHPQQRQQFVSVTDDVMRKYGYL